MKDQKLITPFLLLYYVEHGRKLLENHSKRPSQKNAHMSI